MSANVSKRYSNGKIYQITDVGYNKCYIGSTCLKLRRRFLQHIGGYYKYLKGEAEYTTSYSMFEEFGVENCKVELVENYPCNSKDELLKQEGFHIRSFDCVNKCIYIRQNTKRILRRTSTAFSKVVKGIQATKKRTLQGTICYTLPEEQGSHFTKEKYEIWLWLWRTLYLFIKSKAFQNRKTSKLFEAKVRKRMNRTMPIFW